MSSIHPLPFRVLLVDDDLAMHALVAEVLASAEGFELTAVRHGQDALELVLASQREGRAFACAIVDVRMPQGWNGLQSVEAIWQIDPELHVLICTRYSEFAWREIRARLERPEHPSRVLMLQKPFEGPGLEGLVRKLCQRALHRQSVSHSKRDRARKTRLAGMAEIASTALHTLDNIFNALSVSASLLHEKLHSFHLADLRRIAAVADARREVLATAFAQDPAGRLLPELLNAVSATLDGEQAFAAAELDRVMHEVARIREIIQLQQRYASTPRSAEKVQIAPLLDDAWSLCQMELEMPGLRAVREYAEGLPPILVNHHSTLKILVAVFQNARESMEKQPARQHVLTLRTESIAGGGVRLAITDTGAGVAPEHAALVGSYGFSTKPRGHGFNLYHAASTVRRIGGSLRLESSGPGLGATLQIDLPASVEAL